MFCLNSFLLLRMNMVQKNYLIILSFNMPRKNFDKLIKVTWLEWETVVLYDY